MYSYVIKWHFNLQILVSNGSSIAKFERETQKMAMNVAHLNQTNTTW